MDFTKRTTVKQLAATAVATALHTTAARAAAPASDALAERLAPYDPVWTQPSRNAGESMPCGGGDIGLNVWVEDGDLLFYVARSGAFDETNSYLKLGRVRVTLDPSPFADVREFRQTLRLVDGEVEVRCGGVATTIWADVETPVVHVAVEAATPVSVVATLENWRTQDRDYTPAEMSMHRAYDGAPVTPRQLADEVGFAEGGVLVLHRNPDETVFDLLVEQQGMQAVQAELWNPLNGLTFGALMTGDDMTPAGTVQGRYASTDFTGWRLASARPRRSHALRLVCPIEQTPTKAAWLTSLRRLSSGAASPAASRRRSRRWWRDFWSRSHILIQPGAAKPDSPAWRVGRNYQLFRHQLGTNATAMWPTKFNGGNFTYDPEYVDPEKRLTPDYRMWGRGRVHGPEPAAGLLADAEERRRRHDDAAAGLLSPYPAHGRAADPDLLGARGRLFRRADREFRPVLRAGVGVEP